MFTGLLHEKYLAWDHAPHWGKKGEKWASEASQEVMYGGERPTSYPGRFSQSQGKAPWGRGWGKTTSLDHRWARFARQYFFLLDLFPLRRAWSQAREYHDLHMKSSKVCNKTKSPLASLGHWAHNCKMAYCPVYQPNPQPPHPLPLPSIQCNLQWWE